MTNIQDRCRGSIIGGAAGDALGYTVEFMDLSTIRTRFGTEGITRYVLSPAGIALFSDDTQMSLFTAEGLLSAISSGKIYEKDILPYITAAYTHWYDTQCTPPHKIPDSWLSHIYPLWECRAPGLTCLSALKNISMPNAAPVINDSKGCGGVMRVAPIGIFAASHPEILDIEHAGYLAGYAAEITHKHPLSTLSSMALAMIVAECIATGHMDREKFRLIVQDRVMKLIGLYYTENPCLSEFTSVIDRAITLASSDLSDTDAIALLGEGWVAEETLAIAIFSVMRHVDDFSKCLVCAVNHSGDSDSTGAVAGNIIGAITGYSAIPAEFKDKLELHDLLLSVADDLAGASSPEQMQTRYRDHLPSGSRWI